MFTRKMRHLKPRAIEDLLIEARAGFERVDPADLTREREGGALVIDIRPTELRTKDGDLPGATVIERNVLEWRLDPASPHRLSEISGYDQRIIIVCEEGYASSLAVVTLKTLGLHRATDLAGGYKGWLEFNGGPSKDPFSPPSPTETR